MTKATLNWTGYVYGGLAHSSHLRYDEDSEKRGSTSVLRGLKRMGLASGDITGWTVMDVGTGLYGLGFHGWGAVVEHHDISGRTVEALNLYARRQGYANLRSFHTDLVADKLPAEHFDLVYLSGVFQHFEKPVQALINICQSLKVGGYLYIDIYRSGRWRWFVVDVLRRIAQRSLLHDILSRFTEFCALGETRSFYLRQVELLVDDLFVENLHLFHPCDLMADAEALGLSLQRPVTTMDLVDSGDKVDHGLFFAHVFNTLVFRKVCPTDTGCIAERTTRGRCQLAELDGLSNSYREVADSTAEFILAHQGGKFPREHVISHIVNLFRMAHPCLPGDPYLQTGKQDAGEAISPAGDEQTLAQRHALWCTFLANVLNSRNPMEPAKMQSLGYELARFLPERA